MGIGLQSHKQGGYKFMARAYQLHCMKKYSILFTGTRVVLGKYIPGFLSIVVKSEC